MSILLQFAALATSLVLAWAIMRVICKLFGLICAVKWKYSFYCSFTLEAIVIPIAIFILIKLILLI